MAGIEQNLGANQVGAWTNRSGSSSVKEQSPKNNVPNDINLFLDSNTPQCSIKDHNCAGANMEQNVKSQNNTSIFSGNGAKTIIDGREH